ncbi:hypothetical protein D3C83_154230 [compost metagenome]
MSVTTPASCAAFNVAMLRSPSSVKKKFEKSSPPNMKPSGGLMMSLTSEFTMPEKAAPITTPTARSMALPRMAKVLNS